MTEPQPTTTEPGRPVDVDTGFWLWVAAMLTFGALSFLFKDNPLGMFSPTNPAVKCPKTGYSYVGDPPTMVMP